MYPWVFMILCMYYKLCDVGFEGRETVAEVGCGAVEGYAGEVAHRRNGGAECSADLAVEDV
jgi:hypothetical protein